MHDHDVIIGRCSLLCNLLSKQAHSRNKANRDLPVFPYRRRAKRRSVISSPNSHRRFSHCWAVCDYGNTFRLRGAAAAHIHMPRLP